MKAPTTRQPGRLLGRCIEGDDQEPFGAFGASMLCTDICEYVWRLNYQQNKGYLLHLFDVLPYFQILSLRMWDSLLYSQLCQVTTALHT